VGGFHGVVGVPGGFHGGVGAFHDGFPHYGDRHGVVMDRGIYTYPCPYPTYTYTYPYCVAPG
jgi:hypothetical protein